MESETSDVDNTSEFTKEKADELALDRTIWWHLVEQSGSLQNRKK